MTAATITTPTYSFLGDLARARALYARRCPAITIEAARDWGIGGGQVLKAEIASGDLIDEGYAEGRLRPVPEHDLANYARYLRAQYEGCDADPLYIPAANKAQETTSPPNPAVSPRPVSAPQMRDQNRDRETDLPAHASGLEIAQRVKQLMLGGTDGQ